MIRRLRGRLVEREDALVVIDVQGVGFAVAVTPATAERLAGQAGDVEVHVHTAVHDAGIDLYGFLHPGDREIFLRLISVSGIGPRLALNLLGGIEPVALLRAVAEGDLARLTQVSGVGKKTAERLVLELRDRCRELLATRQDADGSPPAGGSLADLRSALQHLGFKPAAVQRVLPRLEADAHAGAPLDALLRQALALLRQA